MGRGIFLLLPLFFLFIPTTLQAPKRDAARVSGSENKPIIQVKIPAGLSNELMEKRLIPKAKVEPISRGLDERKQGRRMKAAITAYYPGEKSTGKRKGDKEYGITASGIKAKAGRTIAMDASIPFGTQVDIVGIGTFIVEDRGGAIKGNKIDLYFDDYRDAIKWGRQTRDVILWLP